MTDKPISEIIKARIVAQETQFFSNDNISEFIKEGELEMLQKEVEQKFQAVLDSLIIDTENDHNTNGTAKRVAKMYVQEVFGGRYKDAPPVTAFPNMNKDNMDQQLYIAGPITIRSTCAHHFQNISGRCYIGVFPGEKVIGLSKFNRLVDWIASRGTIQEEMTEQIANMIQKETAAQGVAVVIKAEHHCMSHRGVKEHSDFTTSAVRGLLRENQSLKSEFFTLLQGMKDYKI